MNDISMVSESLTREHILEEKSEDLNASTKYPGITSSYAPPTKLSNNNINSQLADQGDNSAQNKLSVS